MNESSHWLAKVRCLLDRLRRNWPTERVLRWSSRAARCLFVAAPVLFFGAVALGAYQDNEARRLMPDEPHYDVPSGEVTAMTMGSIVSLLLGACCTVIAAMARSLVPLRLK